MWSGNQAKDRGLVDGFGSFLDAIDHAKARAHLAPIQEVRVVTYEEKQRSLTSTLGALTSGTRVHLQLSAFEGSTVISIAAIIVSSQNIWRPQTSKYPSPSAEASSSTATSAFQAWVSP